LDIPAKLGAATGVYFFPDSCQIGAYSIKAGLVKLLDPNGAPIKIDWEMGYQVGVTVEMEGAVFTGPGPANPSSFSGVFYTIEGSGGEAVSFGASGYLGEANANGSRWLGGTLVAGVGVDGSPLTGGSVAYSYQLMKEVPVPLCACLALIYAMP
jgi:hypothetical protein